MILEEYCEKEIRKIAEVLEIPIINDKIDAQYLPLIKSYLKSSMAKERRLTRKKENPLVMFATKIINGIEVLSSPIEEYLWDELKRCNFDKFARREFEVGKYRIDIAFPICKLGVECDGEIYHQANVLQLERDQKRDKYLAGKGWRILRIEGKAIRRNINFCMEKIKNSLGELIKEL